MQHMLDPDDRDAAGMDGADGRDQLAAFAVGQAAGDFVEQQHFRLGGQRAGQFQPLALKQAQAPGAVVGAVDKAGLAEGSPRIAPPPGLRAARGSESARDEEIFEYRKRLERLRDLECAAHARPGSAPSAARRVTSTPSKLDAPGIDRNIAGDQVEQRRLSRAVRADDAKRLARLKAKAHTLRDRERAEGFADIFKRQDRHRDP